MQRGTMWFKRLLAWCLTMALCCGCTPEAVVVQAATETSGTCGENSWELDSEGILHLRGSGNFASYSADEVPWKAVCSEIKQVTFEMTKVSGGDISYYFLGCTNLKSVNAIPSGVKGMNGTFEGCTGLLSVGTIPDSVQSMCETFKDCSRLNSTVRVPANVSAAKGAFDGCTSLTKTPTVLSSVIYDMEYMFRGTAITTPPSIPGSVKNMTGCFYGCTNLTKAPNIPESVTNLAYCFYQCESMTNAPTLPKKVEDIRYAFWNCTSMTNAPDIPLYVKYMQNCMVGCKSVSGTMTIYAVITEEENYYQFAGETMVYDISTNPKFLGGGGTGLAVSYTNRNQAYIREYLGAGWNSGAIRYYDNSCGKLSLGDMLTADVSDCEVESIVPYTYTGKAHRPKPDVFYGNVQLVEGEDFFYSYENNTDAGTATVHIGGIGEFDGKKDVFFTIQPLSFTEVKATGYTGIYDGNPHSMSIQCDTGAKVEYGTTAGKYTTESCPQYVLPGTYTTYYRVTKPNYETITGSVKVVIREAALTVEAEGFQGEYDGNPHSIQVKATEGATIRYGVEAGAYTTTVCPTYVNAGEYTVYYEVSKTGYATKTGSQTVEISRKKVGEIAFPTAGTITYGERLGNATLTGGSTQYGEFGWETPDAIPTVINEGYVVIFRAQDTENYDFGEVDGFSDGVVKRTLSLNVLPAQGTTPSFSVGMLAEGDVLGVSPIVTDGLVQGSLTWENPLQIVASSVGKYNVKFAPNDCENYDWSGITGYDADEKCAFIKTQVLVVQYPEVETICYGQTLAESTLKTRQTGVEYEWKNSTEKPEKSGYYEAVFRAGDESIVRNVWLHLDKAVPEYEIPVVEDVIYDPKRSLSKISLPEGWAWSSPEQIPEVESQGYEAVYTPADTEHYVSVRKVLSVQVKKAEPSVEVPYIVGKKYRTGQTLADIPLPYGWKWQDETQPTKGGKNEYAAVFVPEDTANYEIITKMIEVELEGGELLAPEEPETPKSTTAPQCTTTPDYTTEPGKTTENQKETISTIEPENPAAESESREKIDTSTRGEEEAEQQTQLMVLSSTSESQEASKEIQEGISYEKKIAAWIREIDEDGKKATRVKIRAARRKGKKAKVKWKKVARATGYQVVCTTKKSIKKGTKKRYTKKCSATISLKKKKKHYIKVRAVFKSNGKKVYGKWSKRKAV